jgi:rubredoxin
MITGLSKKQQKDVAKLTNTFSFEKACEESKSAKVINIGGAKVVSFPKVIKHKTVRDYRDVGFAANPRKCGNYKKHLKKRTVARVVKRKRIGRHKSPSISKLKKKADAVFSNFIRARDNWTCVLCGRKEIVQCGHLIKRGKAATRYDEINCHCLCSICNFKDQYETWHYATWFIKEYGATMFKDLVEKSKGIKQMKRQDYLDLIEKYASNPAKD